MEYIFFVNRFPLNQDFANKQEFCRLEDDGFKVKYLDMSVLFGKAKTGHLLAEGLDKWNVTIESKKMLYLFLKEYVSKALVVSFVQYMPNSAWMYMSLFKSGLPYVVAQNPNPPRLKRKASPGRSFSAVWRKTVKRFYFAKLYEKPVQLIEYSLSKHYKRPALLAYSFSSKKNKSMALLCDEDTEFVYTTAADYKAAQRVSDERPVSGDYALFVDQFFCHHTDFKTNHIVHQFSADEYYTLLNKYLQSFSEKHNVKVVVAGHPRRVGEYSDDIKFPTYLDMTPELVRDAKVVLVHFSTAIAYSVIFKRPICFLDAHIFERSTVRTELERFANFFHAEPQRMELPVMGANTWTDPASDYYKKYMSEFLKDPKATNVSLRELLVNIE